MNIQQERLVEENINLVHHTIKTYFPAIQPNTDNYDEAFSQGCEALCKAAISYKPDSNNKFSTYAVVCIKNSLVTMSERNARYRYRISDVEYHDCHIVAVNNDYSELIDGLVMDKLFKEGLPGRSKNKDTGLDIIKDRYEGLSAEEICIKRNISKQKYKDCLAAARQKLKERQDII